jgi:hypothetical protein
MVQVKLVNSSAAVRVPVTFTLLCPQAQLPAWAAPLVLPVLTGSNGVATRADLIAGQPDRVAFRVLVSRGIDCAGTLEAEQCTRRCAHFASCWLW